MPPDLDRWLTDALGSILDGADPAAELEVRVRPGAWRDTPPNQTRYEQRNAALTVLFGMASGAQMTRGERVLTWADAYQAGRCVSPEIAAELDRVEAAGIPLPGDARSIVRIALDRSSGAPVVTAEPAHATVTPSP